MLPAWTTAPISAAAPAIARTVGPSTGSARLGPVPVAEAAGCPQLRQDDEVGAALGPDEVGHAGDALRDRLVIAVRRPGRRGPASMLLLDLAAASGNDA